MEKKFVGIKLSDIDFEAVKAFESNIEFNDLSFREKTRLAKLYPKDILIEVLTSKYKKYNEYNFENYVKGNNKSSRHNLIGKDRYKKEKKYYEK